MTQKQLLSSLINNGYLKTPIIIEAFKKIDRAGFVPENMKDLAYIDDPLPIGHGQTISQPLTVAIMFEFLDPRPGQKILDVGFGSGWTAALLAHVVGNKGQIFALEIIPEVYEFGKKNIEKCHLDNVRLFNQSGYRGLPKEAPFDRILVSASTPEIPQDLENQLKLNGKLVIPVRNSIFEIKRKGDNEFEEKEHFGFSFVPFVEN